MSTLNIVSSHATKSICNGLGCPNEATNTISEEVRGKGMIVLDLCDDCVTKFYD
jgi:hypothetical protein